MSTHSLLVTHLPLTDLAKRTHGTYRRLATLAEAVAAVGRPLHIVCTSDGNRVGNDTEQVHASVEKDIRERWGVTSTVTCLPPASASRLPWIAQQFAGTLSYAHTPSLRAILSGRAREFLKREIAGNPALVVAHRLPAMYALATLGRPLPVTHFDMDDVEHVAARRAVPLLSGTRRRFFAVSSLPALLAAERTAVRTAHTTYVCSQQDADLIATKHAVDSAKVLPNAVQLAPPTSIADSAVLLMVGAYAYGPNGDGADYFIERVFPLIRNKLPHAEVWFAGAGANRIRSFSKHIDGVRYLGYVDSLEDIYRTARAVICPIRYGSGTRVKLLEAAAWGKPIVTTTLGAEGLEMKAGKEALFADSDEDFASSCVTLLQDAELCGRLAQHARAIVAGRYDRRKIIEQLAAVFGRE